MSFSPQHAAPDSASLSRRRVLGSATALAGAGAVGLLGAAGILGGGAWAAGRMVGAPELRTGPLRIGYLPITDATALLTAHAQGLYASHGVQVSRPVMFRSWASLAEALVSGKIDAAHMLMPMAVYLTHQLGADASVVAWNHTNGSALTLGRGAPDLAALAGRTFAIPSWYSVHSLILQKMLRAQGLEPVTGRTASGKGGEVTLMPMAPSDMIPALDAGSIGGFAVADPFNAMAAKKGVGRTHRFLGDVWRGHACCVTVLSGALLRERRSSAHGFLAAVVDAQSRIDGADSRRRAAYELSAGKYLPQPLADIEQALDSAASAAQVHRNPQWHGERIGFDPYPHPSYTEELVKAMQSSVTDADTAFLQELDPAQVHGKLVDASLLTEVLQKRGTTVPRPRTEEIRV